MSFKGLTLDRCASHYTCHTSLYLATFTVCLFGLHCSHCQCLLRQCSQPHLPAIALNCVPINAKLAKTLGPRPFESFRYMSDPACLFSRIVIAGRAIVCSSLILFVMMVSVTPSVRLPAIRSKKQRIGAHSPSTNCSCPEVRISILLDGLVVITA